MRLPNSCFFARQFPQLFLQFLTTHGVGAKLSYDDACREVGKEGSVPALKSARKACGKDGDDRIARARYIEDFLRPRRNMNLFTLAHERHAVF